MTALWTSTPAKTKMSSKHITVVSFTCALLMFLHLGLAMAETISLSSANVESRSSIAVRSTVNEGSEQATTQGASILQANETVTLLLAATTFYTSPQLIVNYIVSPCGISLDNATEVAYQAKILKENPIQVNIDVFDPTTNNTFTMDTTYVKTFDTFYLTYPPTLYGNLSSSGLMYQVNITAPANSNQCYNIPPIQITILQTQLTMDNTLLMDFPVCPGRRYLFVDGTVTLWAYNMTFHSSSDSFSSIYEHFAVKHNSCPNSTNHDYDYWFDDASPIQYDYDGITLGNIVISARWWIELACADYKVVPVPDAGISLRVKSNITCFVNCFEHGTCIDKELPYCLCSTWWDGDDCTHWFKGNYVLIVMGIVVTVFTIGFATYKVTKYFTKTPYRYNDEEDDDYEYKHYVLGTGGANMDTMSNDDKAVINRSNSYTSFSINSQDSVAIGSYEGSTSGNIGNVKGSTSKSNKHSSSYNNRHSLGQVRGANIVMRSQSASDTTPLLNNDKDVN